MKNQKLVKVKKQVKNLLKSFNKKSLASHANPIPYLVQQLTKYWPFEEDRTKKVYETIQDIYTPKDILDSLKESLHKEYFLLLEQVQEVNGKQSKQIQSLTIKINDIIKILDDLSLEAESKDVLPSSQLSKEECKALCKEIEKKWKVLTYNPPKIWKASQALNERIIHIHDFTVQLSYNIKKLFQVVKIELLKEELDTGSLSIHTDPIYIHLFHTPAQHTLLEIIEENYPKWIKSLIIQLYEKGRAHCEDISFFTKQMKILDKDLHYLSKLTNTIKPTIQILEEALYDQDCHQTIQQLYTKVTTFTSLSNSLIETQFQLTHDEITTRYEELKTQGSQILENIEHLDPLIQKTIAFKEGRCQCLASYDLHTLVLKQTTEDALRRLHTLKETQELSMQTLLLVEKFDHADLNSEEKYQFILSLKRLLKKEVSVSILFEKLEMKTQHIHQNSIKALQKDTKDLSSYFEKYSFLYKHIHLIKDHLLSKECSIKASLDSLIDQICEFSQKLVEKTLEHFLQQGQWLVKKEVWLKAYYTFCLPFGIEIHDKLKTSLEELVKKDSSIELARYLDNLEAFLSLFPRIAPDKKKYFIFLTEWGKLLKKAKKKSYKNT